MVFKHFMDQVEAPKFTLPILKPSVHTSQKEVQESKEIKPITQYIKPENMERENYVESFYTPSENIKTFIKTTENFKPEVYKDSKGIPTIGFGFTDKKLIEEYRDKPMSIETANRLLEEQLNSRVNSLKKYNW